jgi:tripartite-type tricarboxylate transporter receptor subunit TctC
MDQPAFARYVADEARRWSEVIRTAGIAQD